VSRRRRVAAARSRAREAAERAMLAALDHPAGQGRTPSPAAHVHRLLDAVEAAGVRLVPARPEHLAAQSQLDPAAHAALGRLAQALVYLHTELDVQQQAAAAGPGTLLSDIRARLSDPTPGRLVPGADGERAVLRDPRGIDGARFGDPGEVRRLAELHRDSLHRIDSESALLLGEIWLEERPEWATLG
jgi:hypothetical protein